MQRACSSPGERALCQFSALVSSGKTLLMTEQEALVELTANIVAAHVKNNTVAVGDVATLIKQVHQALSAVGERRQQQPETNTRVVSIRASVKPGYIVCMKCGKKQKMLRRHLRTAHEMTPEEYRRDYGLAASYPMTAPDHSERRRQVAKRIGLGRKPGQKVKHAPRGPRPHSSRCFRRGQL